MQCFNFLKGCNDEMFENCRRINRLVGSIIERKYGIDVSNIEDVKNLVEKKGLSIVYQDNVFIGVSSNNRWLYTIDGKTIGKQGRRYRIELLAKPVR